ncbi:MAG: Asp-tRNA(Asn)/Glu-tRNA(Gln) amidotransferase subunit GatC [Acidobacteriota bacterium]
MTLGREDVQRIANLARLDLTPAEAERYTEQLNRMVDFCDQLQQLDVPPSTEWREPQASPEAEDRDAPCLPRRQVLHNAPQHHAGLLTVPAFKSVPKSQTAPAHPQDSE